MNILQIGHNYHIAGGSDRVLIESKSMLENFGHSVIPFCAVSHRNQPSNYQQYFVNSIDLNAITIKSALSFFYNLEARKKIRMLLNENNVDIAHLHIYYGKLTTSILNPLIEKKVPIVQTLHEYKLVCPVYTLERNGVICNDCVSGTFLNCIRYKCKDNSVLKSSVMVLESYISRALGDVSKIDLFLSVSFFHKRIMIQGGIPPEKIEVLYNFVDTEYYIPTYEVGDYYLYFGRIEKLKGIDTLIQAFSQRLEKKLLIVGQGSYVDSLLKSISQLPNISYVGFKSGTELIDIISKCKAVIVPSEWYENCPMNVLEAKALGKPVIGSNIGGIPELINNGKDGLLFEPGSSLELACCLDEIDEQVFAYGKYARLDVENRFSKNSHYNKLNMFYQKISKNR